MPYITISRYKIIGIGVPTLLCNSIGTLLSLQYKENLPLIFVAKGFFRRCILPCSDLSRNKKENDPQ